MQIAALRTAKPMRYSCLHCGNTLATSPLSGAIWTRDDCPGFWVERYFQRANHSIRKVTKRSFRLMRGQQRPHFPRFLDENGQDIADDCRFAAGACQRWAGRHATLARVQQSAQAGSVAGNPLQRVSLCSHRKGPKPFPRRTVRNQRLCAVRRYGVEAVLPSWG